MERKTNEFNNQKSVQVNISEDTEAEENESYIYQELRRAAITRIYYVLHLCHSKVVMSKGTCSFFYSILAQQTISFDQAKV